MIGRTARPLNPIQWIVIPALLSVLATIVVSVPVQVFGLRLPEPVFFMAPLFAWALIRPSILAPFAALASGLFLDLWWGSALGLWGLTLVLAYGLVLFTRNLVAGQGRAVLWLWYGAVTALAMGGAYLFTMLDVGSAASPLAVFWQTAATAALFPLAHRMIEHYDDVDGPFR